MTKKSKKNNLLDVCLLGGATLFGVLTLLLMIAPGAKGTVIEWQLNVYELINYLDKTRVGVLLAVIFAACLLAFALLLVVLKLLGKKTKFDLVVAFCGALLGIVAAVLLFMTKNLIGEGNNGYVALGVGAVLAAIFAIISACSLCLYAVLKLKK